ncbi:hypothetical protein NLI96_g4615 [Meripilus lineatus]|uniref:Cytochrome P450 n=1 Tax=Meripilus lineatus TaxID=2056292 RepID=A0AAD5YEL7_9APHY|nr:hypothetical protein NLI96_g4615 [Physisporinus lineatus]
MPLKNQHLVFYEWSKLYGDVIGLKGLGRSVVVLNSAEAARDLLEKRSSIYSDRPRFPMVELMGWMDSVIFLPYGKKFHESRKVLQHQLNRQDSAVFQESQLRQASVLVQRLMQSPENFEEHLQCFASSVVMEIAYGHQVSSDDDPYLRLAKRMNEMAAGLGSQGSNPVDFLPILKHLPAWFPGAWWIRYSQTQRPMYESMMRYGFDEVRKQMALGTANPSFLSRHLEHLVREGREDDEDSLKCLMASSWALYAVLALVLHPHVQRKAQEEIDRVVGSQRLPDFGDRDSLPYVQCVANEVMRWHPVAPLGIPHRVMEDDVYKGMFIPKGSTIIPNIRSMTLDPRVYREPHTFWPERFLPQPAGPGEPQPECAFGFGRRICPGRYLAEASLWIVVATLLSTFDIYPAKDEHGNDIIPCAEFNNALTSHPLPFECEFRVRSESKRRLDVTQ